MFRYAKLIDKLTNLQLCDEIDVSFVVSDSAHIGL